jgi:hypothetical protein
VPQSFALYGLRLTLWGTPWAISHNGLRGNCLNEAEPSFPWAKCQVTGQPAPQAYLTLPSSCTGPLAFAISADSWQDPGAYLPDGEPDFADTAWKRVGAQAPALGGCASVPFAPRVRTVPSSDRVSSASGFDFALEQDESGLLSPQGTAPSPLRKTVVALPEGVTINPSVAAGLGSCTTAQYAAETVSSPEGAGCPNNSKIGDVKVASPLLAGPLEGSIYLAQPRQNQFGSLLALYLVARSAERGILVKVAGQLAANERTGQLTASFDGLPQLPYSRLDIEFREGQRAPLLNPEGCGTYASQIDLSPWLDPSADLHQSSSFQLAHGIGGVGCPSGTPPFAPGAAAGTLNANPGSYTPFYLHLTRGDGDQEITSYSAQLPPGLLANISDVPFCPEAAIAAAARESGVGEEAHPSCPAASEIGHTYSGFGVGPVLAYAPGRLYLAGPYHGAPLSVVAIDAATVGPFDLGVIVIRSAIEIDPTSAQVSIDSAGSDPIPHIIDGIPLHLRDIRVYLSRPGFTLNPTSCAPFSVVSGLTGSAAPFASPDDIGASVTVPFQLSNCSSLRFDPRFALKLRGGHRRGDFPSLRAVYRPRAGNANVATAAVTLPHSEFLEQAHIRSVCTKRQLDAEACPKGSVYGSASAATPLLGEPMRGPVYLATGFGHTLPDLVTVLHGRGVRIVLDGRIDAHHGGIRATFTGLPDAPVTKFVLTLAGGRRDILANERNVCTSPEKASASFVAQDHSGVHQHPPLLVAGCHRRGKGAKQHRRRK